MSTAAFWNRTAKKYAKSRIPNPDIYEEKIRVTQAHLTPESDVLEVACGTGTTALLHASYAKHIDAWDISENMLAIARDKQTAQGIQNISFHCADVDQMPWPPNHYDMVMAHSILHLVQDKKSTLCNIYKTLKPGGVFISSTACLSNNMNWLKVIAKPMHLLGFWPAVYFFTSQQLEEAIISAGFSIEKSWLPPKAMAHFFIARKPI